MRVSYVSDQASRHFPAHRGRAGCCAAAWLPAGDLQERLILVCWIPDAGNLGGPQDQIAGCEFNQIYQTGVAGGYLRGRSMRSWAKLSA